MAVHGIDRRGRGMKMILSKFRDMPLRKKLFLSIIIFIILPLTVTAFFINSYFFHQNIRNITETNLQILKQTEQGFVSLINEADNLSVRILSDDKIQTLLSYDSNAGNPNYLETIVSTNRWLYNEFYFCQYVDSIVISTKNDSFQLGNSWDISIGPEMMKKAVALNGVGLWSDVYQANSTDGNRKVNVISYFRAINNLDVLNKNLAVEMITINEDKLFQLYSKLNTYKGGEIYLLGADERVISSTDKKMIGTKYDNEGLKENLLVKNEGFFEDKSQDSNNIILYYTIPKTGWKLVQVIPGRSFLPMTNTINTVIFIAIFFCSIFGILFSIIQDRVILKPLKNLVKEMEKLREGNFNMTLATKSNDEVGKIIKEYTGIIRQLKELINTVYISKMKQREAELIALEAQINPHFLYNTLDSIRWLALKDKNYKVSEQLEALSEMFRHVLHNGKEIVTVREEMEFIDDYMFLQQAKYGSRIKLVIHAEDELYDCLMPKLVLQPLVENAVLHGLEPKLEGGRIEVSVRQEGENIRFTVSDDGVGTDGGNIRAMIRDKGQSFNVFALKNIDERIKLQYGENYGLDFSSEKGQGVRVEILIPLKRQDRGEIVEITGGR